MFHSFYVSSTASANEELFTSPRLPHNFQTSSNTSGRLRTTLKACKRCRNLRIRCGEKPCLNCINRGVPCIKSTDSNNTNVGRSSPWRSRPSFVNGEVPRKQIPALATISSTCGSSFEPLLSPAQPSAQAFESLLSTIGKLPLLAMPLEPGVTIVDIEQQCCFLRMFWTECHPQFPIMSEQEFRQFYNATLNQTPTSNELKTATVDCMIALGFQSACFTGTWHRILDLPYLGSQSEEGVAWPGISHFRRAQEVLRRLSACCLDAIRCYGLLALYLRKAGDVEAAYNIVGIGIRRAAMSNLTRECLGDSHEERIVVARVWWSLYSLDAFCSVQLDVPFYAPKTAKFDSVLPKLPETPIYSLCDDAGACEYLSYIVKLADAVTIISIPVQVPAVIDNQDKTKELKKTALSVSGALAHLDTWRSELPERLSSRYCSLFHDDGFRASAALEEMNFPTWLQRQRLMLALEYHSIRVRIQRPFLCIYSANSMESNDLIVQTLAQRSVEHAVAVIHSVNATCAVSEDLYGWCEVLQSLWAATETILAYLHLKPLGSLSSQASKSIPMAKALFKFFAKVSPVAARAESIIESQMDNGSASLSDTAEIQTTTAENKLPSTDHVPEAFTSSELSLFQAWQSDESTVNIVSAEPFQNDDLTWLPSTLHDLEY